LASLKVHLDLDFAATGYATPWGDRRGELRLSPLETVVTYVGDTDALHFVDE
jgi:hypothetical protein